jgi:hypothetical protein
VVFFRKVNIASFGLNTYIYMYKIVTITTNTSQNQKKLNYGKPTGHFFWLSAKE